MSLSIILSNESVSAYSPGAIVFGMVRLVITKDQEIGVVDINLVGRTKVVLLHSFGDMTTSRKDYKSCGILFNRVQRLHEGTYTYIKGTYTWPFVFEIPDLADIEVGDQLCNGDAFDENLPWRPSGTFEPHPLPPSMYYSGGFQCSVDYVLEAKLLQSAKSKRVARNNKVINRRITLQNGPPLRGLNIEEDLRYDTYHHQFRVRYYKYCPPTLDRLLTEIPARLLPKTAVRQWRVELLIKLMVPRIVDLDLSSTIPIKVTAQCLKLYRPAYYTKLPEDKIPEPVHIEQFEAFVWICTRVRAGSHHLSERRKVVVGKGKCDISLTCKSGAPTDNPTTASSYNTIDLGEMLGLRLPEGKLVPDFRTFNIYRAHCLTLIIKTRYADRKFKFRFGEIPIRIFSNTHLASNQIPPYPDEQRNISNNSVTEFVLDSPPPPY